MLRAFIFFIVFVTAVSCGEKREIVSENMTADFPIESVATSENQTISEGNALFAQGDFSTAIGYYKDAMQQNRATAFYNIGVCYYLLNNIPQAELNFREAVAADPQFDEAVMNLVAVLAQQEKVPEAENFITRLIRTSKSTKVYVSMANISLKLGDTAKAAYYYKQALDIDSKSQYILANYANFLISIGEYQDGVNILEKFENKDFSVNYNLANAYRYLGDMSSALSYAGEALYSSGATEEGCNKLAALFYDYKRYQDEAQSLRMLISLIPKKEYKVRLVRSYINSREFSRALDELSVLLRDYPTDVQLNVINYEVLIFSDEIEQAGKFIRQAYKKLGGDELLYYYAKHVCLYEKNKSELLPLIFVKRESPWLNLSRTIYSLKMDNIPDANKYIARVPESVGHEYYYYKTYLLITAKRFIEADVASKKMEQDRPDTFWYRLVITWNLRQPDAMLALADQFRDSPSITRVRTPSFRYDVIPVLEDMGFSYRFEDKGPDAAAMLAYPIFLEPDDIVQFLIMGRSTLKDAEKNQATKKLEGMKRNNEGIDAYYVYDFTKALKKFEEAGNLLPGNVAVLYNIGIANFNLGANKQALEFFNKAIAQDKEFGQAYFGAGLANYRNGDRVLAGTLFEQAVKISSANIDSSPKPLLDDIRNTYLSIMAGNRIGKKAEAESIVKTDDALAVSCGFLMDYFETYQPEILNSLNDSPVFRVSLIQDLLKMRHIPATQYTEADYPDRYYTLAKKYVMLERGSKSATGLNKRFADDMIYLKDMVYGSIFQNDKAAGLKYLQRLTNLDYTFADLYKASLYYFIWTRDFVNAEASYGSLDRMQYEDRLTAFYMMLYFLANYNEPRLSGYLKQYDEKFGADYRSGIVSAIVSLNTKSIGTFYSTMSKLLKDDPYIFNKIFIEVNFEKF